MRPHRSSVSLLALSLLTAVACTDRGRHHVPSKNPDLATTPDLATAAADLAKADLSAPRDLATETDVLQVAVDSATHSAQIPFLFNASGSGTGSVGAITVNGSIGTLAFSGSGRTLKLAGFRGLSFASPKLYEFVGVDSSGLFIVSLLCQQSSGQLTQVWLTDFSSGVQEVQGASGTCSGTFTPSTIQLALPSSFFTVTPSEQIAITSLDGKLSLAKGKVGTIEIAGVDYSLIPLNVIDCRTGCSSAYVGLAALIVSKTAGSVALTDLLMHPATPNVIEVRSVFFFPEFEERLPFTEYNATWSMN